MIKCTAFLNILSNYPHFETVWHLKIKANIILVHYSANTFGISCDFRHKTTHSILFRFHFPNNHKITRCSVHSYCIRLFDIEICKAFSRVQPYNRSYICKQIVYIAHVLNVVLFGLSVS